MKKLLSKLALMLVVALVMGLGIAVPAMADPPPPMTTTLRKNLIMPPGVSVTTAMNFEFNFAPVPAAVAPAMPTQTAPAIVPNHATNPIVVTVPAGQTTGYINLNAAGGILPTMMTTHMATLNAGTIEWIVTENVTNQAGVTYSTQQYRLRVHLQNNMVGGVVQNPPLIIGAVEVFDITDAPPEVKVGDDGFIFTNVFAPLTPPGVVPLTVSKEIIGDDFAHANLGTLFRFNMTLTAPVVPVPNPPIPGVTITQPVLPGTPAGTFTATIVSGPGAGTPITDRSSTVNFVGGVATPHFELRHGERLVFPTLPAGTTYVVTEIGTPNFTPFVNVIVGGSSVTTPPLTAGIGLDLGTGDHGLVSNAVAGTPPVFAGNSADFQNRYHWAPPQGLVITNAPFFAVGFAALALTLMMASRSRKRIEEMPIAY